MTQDQVREFLGSITNEQWGMFSAAAVVFVFVLIIIFYNLPRARERRELESRRREEAIENYQRELRQTADAIRDSHIANIVERVTVTGFGSFCVLLLLVNWLISIFMYLQAPTITQQMGALLVWIGGNTMFGIGVLISQTRTYQVSRQLRD